MLDNQVKQCRELISEATSIAALTGAGISTNAGIPDFRGPQGLYISRRYDPDKVFDIRAFLEDPNPFFEFARDFIELEKNLRPTASHHFLSALERQGKLKGVITQNIDGLHQRAGSENVLEMHGSFLKGYCLKCAQEYSYEQMKVKLAQGVVPRCDIDSAVIKPDVVFFGENVKHYQAAVELAESVDLFFIIGTSCVVFPAASIPKFAQGKIVIVNQGEVNLSLFNVAMSVDGDCDHFFEMVAEDLQFNSI